MTTYAYLCDACGRETLSQERGDRFRCESCGGVGKRRFGFRTAVAFQDHFNATTGSYVRNERDFRDQLKRAAEVETEKTGVYHDYQPVDMNDREAFGITDAHLEALEPTRKIIAEKGIGVLA